MLATGGTAQAQTCALPPALPAAQWDVVPPSCFEGGDGNLIVDNVQGPGRTDWATIAEETFTDASGDADLKFDSGAAGKEFDPGSWRLVADTVTPAKIDLLASATRTDPVSGDLFLYEAFLRAVDNGDANVSFELNQNPALWDNDGDPTTPAVPTRTAGDVLIPFDGHGDPTVGMCVWKGPREGTSVDPDAGWYTLPTDPVHPDELIGGGVECTELRKIAEPLALGRLNQAALANPGYLADFPANIDEGLFGEITVNMTRALQALPQPCFDFGSIWLHSRNSHSASADMGDYFAPHPLTLANCDIDVDKTVAVQPPGGTVGPYHQGTVADPAYAATGDTLHYAFAVLNSGEEPVVIDTVTDSRCDATPTLAPEDKKDATDAADPTPASFDPGDVWTYRCTRLLLDSDPNPFPNTVTVDGHVESTPPFPVSATDDAEVLRLAEIVIRKDQVGGADTDVFSYTASALLDPDGFTHSEAAGDLVFDRLVPNDAAGDPSLVYAVTEGTSPHWTLTDLDCLSGGAADGDSTADTATRTASVTVSSGERVVCTFQNTRNVGTIEVVKTLAPVDDAGRFDLLVDGLVEKAAAGHLDTTGDVVVVTGSHTVAETAVPPAQLALYQRSIVCRDGATVVGQSADGAPVTVDVAKDQSIVCEVHNARLPQQQPPPPPPPPPGPPAPPAPAPLVGQAVSPGSARLEGPSGCPRAARFRTWVTGRQIRSVRFLRDRRTLGTVTRPDSRGRWIISVPNRGLKRGAHRIRAIVTFRPESRTRTRTLQLRYSTACQVLGERARGFTG